jgi:type VI secretion system secreted protein VgrG
MGGTGLGTRSQGNQADYLLGTTEGWNAYGVVRWHGIEELSQPYRYEITLQRQVSSGAADLDALLDSAATFAIAGQNKWRLVHGILAEAEEIDRTSQLILYRVLLVPPFWRARYRRRCRNFHKQSLKEIISSVLENKSPAHPQGMGGLTRFTSGQAPLQPPSFSSFTPPIGTYRWEVKGTTNTKNSKDAPRIEDRTVRPYVVQYNESDFDFVSRLLEDEGLTYSFEHALDQVVLAITDTPGVSPLFDDGASFVQHRVSISGTSEDQEIVRAFRDTRRLRSRAVTVRDWDYFRSAAPLEAKDEDTTATQDPDLSRHFEFPVGEEAVLTDPGQHAATVRKQRYDAERALREGSSTVRTMVPGYRFTLVDGDGINPTLNLLAVRVETYATELTPQGTVLDDEPFGFTNFTGPLAVGDDSRFLALSESLTFRPPMRTPKPRIHGVQAAVVTAEEYPNGNRPAINGDELGRVRVRFPWDQRPDTGDKTPTSRWIRVSQFWAGGGYGALYTPRVGHEVLVAYMQGDPDQPVIVGRVYNAQHTPPYDAKAAPTKSTVKSQSAEVTKEVDGFNEIRFEDKAKHEQIYVHAQGTLDEVVLGSHSTSVGGDQTNAVMGGRTHTVGGEEHVTVERDRHTLFKLNEFHTVNVNRDTHIKNSELHHVDVYRNTFIDGNDDLHVKGWRNAEITTGDRIDVTGPREVIAHGGLTTDVTGTDKSIASAEHLFFSKIARFLEGEEFGVGVQGCTLRMTPGEFHVEIGGAKLVITPGNIQLTDGKSGSIGIAGGIVTINGASLFVNMKTAVDILGSKINLGDK